VDIIIHIYTDRYGGQAV